MDVIVIGAGAAGLFCAATAVRRGRRVVVVDHAAKPGRKILVSGGGRCNFTNRSVGPVNYLSRNPHFCRSALARFRPQDFLALVEARRIRYEERGHGRLFCLGSAREIVDLLLAECAGAELVLGAPIERIDHDAGFAVATARGVWRAPRLVVATGGRTWPALGATGFGFAIARRFGHEMVETAPALAPLALAPAEGTGDLAGIAVEAAVAAGGAAFHENLLFTHDGISGPAVLQASSYWREGMPLAVDLLPGTDLQARLVQARAEGARTQLGNLLADLLPRRLVQCRLGEALAARPVAQLANAEIAQAVAALKSWRPVPTGYSSGWAKAEVTRGGVDTDGLSSKTMESKLVPGLHFIGEVVDVTGWLGGYNLHWAWASGHAAGEAV